MPTGHSRTGGWGSTRDQYGRLWREDDGQASLPATDLDAAGRRPDRTIEIRGHESAVIAAASGQDDDEF